MWLKYFWWITKAQLLNLLKLSTKHGKYLILKPTIYLKFQFNNIKLTYVFLLSFFINKAVLDRQHWTHAVVLIRFGTIFFMFMTIDLLEIIKIYGGETMMEWYRVLYFEIIFVIKLFSFSVLRGSCPFQSINWMRMNILEILVFLWQTMNIFNILPS